MFYTRWIITILVFLGSFSMGFCQYDDPVVLTMPEDLNTVGFNLTPVIVLAMNSDQYSPRWSVFYKRQLQPNSKFRAQINYENRDKYDHIQRASPLNWSDTTITIIYESRNYSNQDLRFGLEFYNPTEKTSMIYGFDAGIGRWNEYDEELIVPFWNDPEVNNQPVPSPFETSRKNTADVTWAYAVIDFSIGYKMAPNDHLNFILQWTPEVLYQWPIKEEYSSPEARVYPPSDAFFFRLRGIEILMNIVF